MLTLPSSSPLHLLFLFLLPHSQLFRGCQGVEHTHTPVIPLPPSTTPVPSTPAATTTPVSLSPGIREGGGRPQHALGKTGGLRMVKHFYLWTRKNIGNSSSQLLDPTRPDTISGSFFRPCRTYVIIHGFLGWGSEPWILHLKDKLLKVSHSNVISVDWPAGTQWWLPGYYTAVSRVPVVAKDLTDLLNSLVITWGLDLQDVHLIGHSLGAHAAGLAAAPLNTVGRISGLDPAGLMYHKVPANQRLDPSDADYVDVIHTNGCATLNKWLDCYGINENLGHSDFWPNGGQHQPSCVKKKKKIANGEIGCSHEMAYVYYIESLDYTVDKTFYLARGCSSWDDYKGGNCTCGRETQYMGFSVNLRLKGTFYLNTNAAPPYASQDPECPPGSATGPGVRMIKLVLLSATALIVAGASTGGMMVLVGKRRSAAREVCVAEDDGAVAGGSGSGGDGDGGCSNDVAVEVDDQKVLIG